MARSKRGKKQNDAYFVKELKYTNFIDFKTISQALLRNKTINTQGEKVAPGAYLSINIVGKGRPTTSKSLTLKMAYPAMLPISVQKYNDLKKLCNTGVIPEEYHHWYLSLPFSPSVRNKNPEPSIESDSSGDEN
nr:unnamed protein product [Callosobruchus analis]